MFLIEVFKEKPRKSVAFCFGRMNPPTIGHARLMNTTARAGKGGDYYIFLSHTQKTKKDSTDPLDYNTKVEFVKAMYPQHADHVSHGSLRTIMEIMEFLYHHNYTDITYVCGNDRLATFKELLNKYNGLEGGKTYYKFNSINVVSSGPRDPDDDGIAGVSASSARLAAEKGDLEEFKKITGAGRLAPALYKAVRRGLLLEHIGKVKGGYRLYSHKGKNLGTFSSKAAAEKHEREVQYFKHANEDASGYIPKNKKEAKDPRWSNALSVDVTPETPTKNAKAFRLV
jgi:hypothetical protein